MRPAEVDVLRPASFQRVAADAGWAGVGEAAEEVVAAIGAVVDAGGAVVDVVVGSVDVTSGAAPLALEQDQAVGADAAHEGGVADLVGLIAEDGDVANGRDGHGMVAVVAQIAKEPVRAA